MLRIVTVPQRAFPVPDFPRRDHEVETLHAKASRVRPLRVEFPPRLEPPAVDDPDALADWFADRTDAKVATASTRVPPAVARDEIVAQSTCTYGSPSYQAVTASAICAK